jgi:hypothetical protein
MNHSVVELFEESTSSMVAQLEPQVLAERCEFCVGCLERPPPELKTLTSERACSLSEKDWLKPSLIRDV